MEKTTSSPAIVAKYTDYVKWLNQAVSKFSRQQRYVFGKVLEEKALHDLDKLVRACYQKDKLGLLIDINVDFEVQRHFLRLALSLELLTNKQYQFSTGLLLDVGKQLGGWIRQQKQV